jgi:peptide/nickel transport system substrate-binding protein
MRTGTKRLTGLVALTAVGLLGVAACGTSKSGTSSNKSTASPGYAACAKSPDTCNSGPRKDGGDIVVALGKYPSTWNEWSSDGNIVETVEQTNLISPTTYTFSPSGKIQWNQDLLASEPQVTSTSPQTVVYKLKPTAKWSNGTPISADDFIYDWKTNNGHDKNIPIVGSTGYDSIQSVTGSDNGETVTVVFSKTYSDWRGLFTVPLYPAWYAKQKVGGLDTDAQLEAAFKVWDAPPIDWSGGAYKLSNYQSQQSATFVPNTAWYGAEKPTLKTITFKYITDQTQDVPALQNQEIQALNIQPDQDTVQQLSQIPGVNYEVSAGFSFEHIDVNSTTKFLKDPALREAIFDAINVQDMIDKTIKPFFPTAKILYSHNLVPGVQGYTDITKQTTPDAGTGNIDKAKAVLTAAGYKGVGTNLVPPSGGGQVTINYVHTDTAVRDQSAQLVTQYLSQLGIKVNNKVTADLGGSLGNFDFDMIQFGFSASPLLSGDHDLWYKNAGNNFTHWSDPQSDALLDQMTQELDPVKQAALLNQQDAIMAKAFVDLTLYQKPNLQVATNQYINIRDNNAGSYFTYNTQQWGLNASAS